jgi:hypothetical protein
MSKPYEIISWSSSCSKYKECQNTKCFFKQRDEFGFNPFGSEGNKNREIVKKYGFYINPNIKAVLDTNVIHVICESFIAEQKKNEI